MARGEVEREQVAQHHQLEQPRGAGLTLGLDADHGGGVGLDQLAGQLEAAPLARVLVGVGEQDAGEGASRAPSQPAISLWLASGRGEENAGSFAFSLTWVFQR